MCDFHSGNLFGYNLYLRPKVTFLIFMPLVPIIAIATLIFSVCLILSTDLYCPVLIAFNYTLDVSALC